MKTIYSALASTLLCLTAILVFSSITLSQAPDFQWAKSAGGSAEDVAYSVSTDASGNSYVTGYFTSTTITFGSTTLTSAGSNDIYIVKYDASGNIIWAKNAGGNGQDIAESVVTDSTGNILIAGYFASSSITFGSTTLTNAGSCDMFIVKYGSNGNVLWAKSAGGSFLDFAQSVSTDANGNILVAGSFNSSTITFGSTTLTNVGSNTKDLFLVKYDSNGNVLWAEGAGGTSHDEANSVSTDVSGNVYIAGSFSSSSITFGSTTLTNPGPSSKADMFLVKYDASGNVLWAKSVVGSGSSTDYATSVTADISGNIYVAGNFNSPTITFGSTTLTNAVNTDNFEDIFLVKYDVNGNVIWAKSGGASDEDHVASAKTDSFGNLYLAGYFRSSSIIFGSTTLTNANAPTGDVLIVKYDSNGNVIWAKSAGGSNNDYAWYVATDASNNIFITGNFSSSIITFGSTTLNNSGANDIFLAKLPAPCNVTASAGSDQSNCQGPSATITASATGGSTPYSFLWGGGETTQSITVTPNATTTYFVTVSDANSCSSADEVTIIINSKPSINITSTNVSCNGGGNGSATASGGSSYLWTTGATMAAIGSLSAGNYSVTVTNNNGCSATASTTISEPSSLGVFPNVNNPTCNGNCNGSISISALGGTSPYSFSWSNGQTSSTLSNLCAGQVQYTVTDANNCNTSGNVILSLPSPPNVNMNTGNSTCNGCNDGWAIATVNGGTPPFTYNWSNGQNGVNQIGNLAAGNYNVIVTDSNGCSVQQNFNITQPQNANINFNPDTNGGCAPFTVNFMNQSDSVPVYVWLIGKNFGVDTTIVMFNTSTLTYTFTEPGNYDVALLGYDSSISILLGSSSKNINVKGLSFKSSGDSACAGDQIFFNLENMNGGNQKNYQWDFGDGNSTTSGSGSFHTYSANGIYTVTLIGDGGCGTDTVTHTVVIGNNIIPQIFLDPYNTYVSCPNDKLFISANGSPGIYSWNFGDGSPVVTTNQGMIQHAFPDTGNYVFTVNVTNACGNTASLTDTANIQSNLGFYDQAFFYQIWPDLVCPGDEVGFEFQYPDNFETYVWNFGDGLTDTNHLKTIHSYAAIGNYNASVTVINGCGYDTTLFHPVTVNNNLPVSEYGFIAAPFTSCPGDSVLFLAENGATTYMWHFGDGDSAAPGGINGDDKMNGILHQYADTGTFIPTLTITNGCGNSRTDTMFAPIVISNQAVPDVSPFLGEPIATLGADGPDQLKVCVTQQFISLTGGSLFQWNFGDGSPVVTTNTTMVSHTYLNTGSYLITMVAENSCGNSGSFTLSVNIVGVCPQPDLAFISSNPTCFNSNNGSILVNASGGNPPYTYQWSNGKTTALNGNLQAGTYSVTVTDAYLQSEYGSVSLTSPTAINLSMSNNPASCGIANGIASVTASGGSTPYTYLWSNGQTTIIANNLSAGMYTVTVTGANGCKAVGTTTVNTTVGFAAVFSKTNISCNGAGNGTATINATGGDTPYSYSWSNGMTTQNISLLQAGTYGATVTDGTGCTITGSVQISQPPILGLNLNGTNVSSCGGSNGAVTLNVFGGTSPYTYLWSNGAQTQNISSVPAGIYSVAVTDANGCTKNKSVQITSPSTATVTLSKTNSSCNGGNNGSAAVTVSGGNSPYSYLWGNGATTPQINNLSAQSYSVTVVDSSGCAVSGSTTITQPAPILLSATASPSNCGIPTGNAFANCTGGTSPYSYQWSSGDSSYTADSLVAGVYIVTGTDANGCQVFVSVQVSDVGAPNVTLVSSTNVSCNGENNGAINIAVTGTATPFTYEWSNGAASQDINNLMAGPYEVTVTNSNGCVAVESINILQPDPLEVLVNVNNATCGNSDGSATAVVSGGKTPYSYLWNSGTAISSISNRPSAIYTVTVTDGNGCKQTGNAAIGEVGGPTVILDSVSAANCAGTGSVFVSISDGVPPYTYSWNDGTTNEDLISVSTGDYGLIVTDANGCTGALFSQLINSEVVPDPICLLTVDTATGSNKIVWTKTFGLGIFAYKIYRESSIAGIYQLAGTVPYDSLSVFVDTAANPLIHSWRYKLASLDSCGNESILSAEHKTIHLTVNQGIGNTVNLIWDHYQGFPYGTYYIWRYKPATGWVLKDSIASTLTSWTDGMPPTPFGLRYFVEIKHPDGCFATKSSENHNSSRSNKTYPLAPPAPDLMGTPATTDDNGTCNGTATVTVSGGVSPYSYLWSNGDTTAATDSLCFGTYSCTITDFDGDTNVVNATIQMVNITVIGEDALMLKVFPNPNKGVFTFECKGNNRKCLSGKIVIFNLLGEVIFQTATSGKEPSTSIDLSGNGNGIYFLQLISEKGNSVPIKIIVN